MSTNGICSSCIWCVDRGLRKPIVPQAPQCGNAVRDAPRHTSAPRPMFRIGRGASRTAYPRGAWARWCSYGRLSFLTLQRRLEIAPGSGTLPFHQAALQQIQPLYFSLYR
ncbi:DUF1534 domain-containing protein [Pseudomonas syringae]|nr:DUF1534 domain-containing protein [Pseudomonas syringae]